jgi:hypothetical protein
MNTGTTGARKSPPEAVSAGADCHGGSNASGSRGPFASHAFVFACFTGVSALVLSGPLGCTQIFGFETPVDFCRLDSDCPSDKFCSSGSCIAPCRTNRDCDADESCKNEVCRVNDDAAVAENVPPEADAQQTSTADADAEQPSDADAQQTSTADADSAPDACGDITSDENNCGRCGVVCPSHVCQASACRTLIPSGAYATTAAPNGPLVTTGEADADVGVGVIAGIRIHVAQPGWLVELGTLTALGGTQGYLGLYSNTNGQPDVLLATTAEFTLAGNTHDSAAPQPTIESTTPIHLDADDYWILGMWQDEVAFIRQGGNDGCSAGCVDWYLLPSTFMPLPGSAMRRDQLTQLPVPVLFAEVAE